MYLTLIYAFRDLHLLAACLILLALGSGALHSVAAHRWPPAGLVGDGLNFVAMILVAIAILSEVLRSRRGSSDLVIRAVCLYLILGLAWIFFLVDSLTLAGIDFRLAGSDYPDRL